MSVNPCLEGRPVPQASSSNICIISICPNCEVSLVDVDALHMGTECIEQGLNRDIEKEWGQGVPLGDTLSNREGRAQFTIDEYRCLSMVIDSLDEFDCWTLKLEMC